MWIEDRPIDLSKGAMFLVSIDEEGVQVEQLFVHGGWGTSTWNFSDLAIWRHLAKSSGHCGSSSLVLK